jgi:hypothetical protein
MDMLVPLLFGLVPALIVATAFFFVLYLVVRAAVANGILRADARRTPRDAEAPRAH